MHSVDELPVELCLLLQKQEELIVQLEQDLSSIGEEYCFEAQTISSIGKDLEGRFFIVKEGVLTVQALDRVLFFLEENDPIGFPSQTLTPELKINVDFAVQATSYPLVEIEKLTNADQTLKDAWNKLQNIQTAIYTTLLIAKSNSESSVKPSIRFYAEGDVIVNEGEPAKEVFTLIEGQANVFLKDVLVGEVLEDEIFGAIAALTETNRTASVIASRRCTVAALPVECFRTLIESRPTTTEKLMKDFARTIIDLNHKIIEGVK